MFLRFAYLKLTRPNQGTFTTGTAITTALNTQVSQIAPYGGAGTAAPSTVVFDNGYTYYLNKAYSAVHAALTAVTSDIAPVNII